MRRILEIVTVLVSGAPAFPFSQDFSANGSLAKWTTPGTWAVAGGRAVCTPTEGAEDISNGDMEAGDPPTGWTPIASAALASVADERTGGAGSKSMSVTNGLAATGYAVQTLHNTANTWVRYRMWAKRLGASNLSMVHRMFTSGFADVFGTYSSVITDNNWYARDNTCRLIGNGCQAVAGSHGSTLGAAAQYDDVSVVPLTGLTMYRKAASLGNFRAAWTIATCMQAGLDILVNDPTTPTRYVRAYVDRIDSKMYAWKVIDGTWTAVLAGTTIVYSADAYVEIRHSVSGTMQFYYNNAQVGTDKTVSDVELLSNTYAGPFSTNGGNSLKSFFATAA